MLELKEVHKKFLYKKRVLHAVKGISFCLDKGEVVCLLGPNGAGKTTILRMISTIISPNQGEIYVDGYSVLKEPKQVRERIAYMSQEPDLNPYLNIRDNIKYYLEMQRNSAVTFKEVKDILERFDLSDHWYKKPIQLSTGLKRRVQIACVLSVDKNILFLDEPTTGLDVVSRRNTLEYIRKAMGGEKTVLLTTHILDEAEYLAKRVIIINKGRIVIDDNIDSLKKKFRRVISLWISRNVPTEIISRISEIDGVYSIKYEEKCLIIEVSSMQPLLKKILEILKGVEITDISIEGSKIENIYLRIIEGRGNI